MPIVYQPGLKSAEVDYIEMELNRVFSVEYRKFLSGMNGFYLTAPDYVKIPLSTIDEGTINFDRFFGLLPEEECNDVVCFNKEFIDELDIFEEAVAIGEDGGGNPYVMIGRRGEQGVYYWDRTHLHESSSTNNFDIPVQNDFGNLFLISGSFTEFYDLVVGCVSGAPDFIEDI
ncbi:SMI1/KNR4 family protein [Pseudomonas sp. ADAK2]|uniref:SMI1/KNR4 family protein n=1 Tax=unclassified Pseudomonas TaxID=196821 RepID=UPI001463A847|nr:MULTISPECIES: SMI1/KNR4 family protein [unclassified Pseudomonas]QJI39393.1 SMI1/KNR4 family protein [Pseudomonas sp. ADAK7]QJI45699.1 SMI1/KNR4 family protein [Pseudomonas sp. ADAK2]